MKHFAQLITNNRLAVAKLYEDIGKYKAETIQLADEDPLQLYWQEKMRKAKSQIKWHERNVKKLLTELRNSGEFVEE